MMPAITTLAMAPGERLGCLVASCVGVVEAMLEVEAELLEFDAAGLARGNGEIAIFVLDLRVYISNHEEKLYLMRSYGQKVME